MAKKVKESQNPENLDFSTLMLNYTSRILDECEKKDQISSVIDDGYVLPTGLLTLDWIMNGGIRAGWITSIGPEQSSKTSVAIKMLGSLVKKNIPGYFIDAENALNTENACAIAGIDNPEEYFGRRSADGKDWEIAPKIRYTSENAIEKDFTFMQRILLSLPDKLCRENQWYYVVDEKDTTKSTILESMGLTVNTKLKSQTGRLWYPAPDAKFQMVFIIDSVKAMVTEDAATDADGGSNAMAQQARAFSIYGPKVRGLLRRKHAVVLSINQLRLNPGARFSAPEYEPCGEYLKYATDTRNEMASTSVPDWFSPGVLPDTKNSTKTFGQEPSVEFEKGVDTYFYKKIKNTKMKGGTPWKRAMCRMWGDGEGKFRGFDPVFDVLQYLELTYQITKKSVNKRKEIFGLETFIPSLTKPVQWNDFKKLILGFYDNRDDLKQEFVDTYNLGISIEELPDIKEICHKQIETREAFDISLQNARKNGITPVKEEKGEEEFYDLDSAEESLIYSEPDDIETDFE